MSEYKTYIFCDETKFYLNNNDSEESIYYLGISIEVKEYSILNNSLLNLFKNRRIKSEIYHSKNIFRKRRPRIELMDDLTDFIINNNLQCFQHKYKKNDLFNKAKLLEKYNNEIIDFNKVEFQALFFFMTTLNLYVKDFNPNLLKNKISMYFDRNVYGTKETESFKFPSEKFIISDMTFCEKSKIELLFLPDFLGFLLKKSREFLIQKNDNNELTRNAHKNYLKIKSSINFHSINIRNEVIENTINLIK